MAVTAAQAAQSASALIRNMNASRRLPTVAPSIQRLAAEGTVHIFNVGPWSHERCLGSAGTWYIPRCEATEEYSAMRPIPGIVMEPIPIDERNFQYLQDEGRWIADQVLGIGKMQNPSNSLVKYGVFIAAGKLPSKSELEKAHTALNAYYHELVEEARSYYNSNNTQIRGWIDEKHRLAARKLNMKDEPWVVSKTAETRIECPACGTLAKPSQVLCSGCKFVLDEKRYAEMKGRFAQ